MYSTTRWRPFRLDAARLARARAERAHPFDTPEDTDDWGADVARLPEVLTQAMQGDRTAVQALRRLDRVLMTLVWRRLPSDAFQSTDPADMVQEIWCQLLRTASKAPARFHDLGHPKAFLYAVVQRAVGMRARGYLYATKRDIRRQKPLYDSPDTDDATDKNDALLDTPDFDPVEQAIAADLFAWMLAACTPMQAEVLKLKRLGMTASEIGARLGRHERTIRRDFEAINEQLAAAQVVA